MVIDSERKQRQAHMELDLAALIACRTTNENKPEINRCFDLIETMLADLPLLVRYYEKNGNTSVVWSTEDTLEPDYILSGHIDVVPGPDELFQLQTTDSKLIGRGTSDMKFAIPVFAELLHQMYQEKDSLPSIAIILSSDEEGGGEDGVGYLVNEVGYRAKRAVIIPDGGDNWHVVSETKGLLQLKIRVEGVSAHTGLPWDGENALVKMSTILSNILSRYPEAKQEEWVTTFSVSQLHAGAQINQIPDEAELCFDIRYTTDTDEKTLLAEMQALVGDAEITTLLHADSFKIDIDHPEIKRWAELIRPYCKDKEVAIKENTTQDGRYFAAKGIPTIVSMPDCGEAHADHEWLDKDALELFLSVLLQYLSE